MAISIEEVEKIANLARLKFTQEEKIKLQQELSAILDYVGQLRKVDAQVEDKPYHDSDSVNRMRDDAAQETTPPPELLKLAPDKEGEFYKVKSVLE